MLMPRHCFHRLFEWSVSAMLIGIALTIMLSPHAIAFGDFYIVARIGLGAKPQTFVLFFLLVGVARVAALYANGHWPIYGPRCRAAGALAGALIWSQMLAALCWWSTQLDYVSMGIPLGVPVYACLTAGELLSCYRAASDGRRH